ncbi:IS110 family RNA-guided transposase [Paralysiella testudinis]|uniref:IS110 family transposase n=1 Tax=Paralysiella testudinis TaxID=2809020 RepID=A0A892ZLM5_9NEIS|nr:IS110 family transposase [Paralysiella testudinis]QRQ81789.1 IS110 family transposase [Paralysiella testudinis]
MNTTTAVYLGLDVSKSKIDACLKMNDRYFHRVIKNDPTGFEKLSEWIAKYTPQVHACCEATGTYSEAIADYLHDHGHLVSVVNPFAIKSYANTKLQCVKTDKQDAKIIARFCADIKPDLYTPPSPSERQLKALTRQLDYYKDMHTAQLNRLQVAHPSIHDFIDKTIDNLRQQIAEVQAAIQAHIAADESLQQKADLLKTVRAVGDATVPHLLALFAEREFNSNRAVTKFVGLNPIIKQSGTKKTSYLAISKMGDKFIRTALYMPAVVAFRLPEFKPFIQRMRDNGKHNKQIICALMRKLLTYCYAVLKSGQPFDPKRLNPEPV